MDSASKTRAAAYSLSAATGAAVILSNMGYATYDAATGMFDLAPISVFTVAGMAVPIVASVLALIAVTAGWGGKP